MHDHDENELSVAEREMIAALPRELPASDMLEERVVRALRKEGHFGAVQRRSRWLPVAMRIAAAAALFTGGVATGRFLMTPAEPQTASAGIPASTREHDTIPVNSESVVAVRELWL